MKKNETTKITVSANMNNVFDRVSKVVEGLQYTANSTRFDYTDAKQRRSHALKFECNKWTNRDTGLFDGYGFYIGRENKYNKVGEKLSQGEQKRTKGGSYDYKKEYYIWVRTSEELDTLIKELETVNGKQTATKQRSKASKNAKKAVKTA